MIAVFEQVLILFAFCLVGFLLSKTKVLNESHAGILSTLLIYVFSPCLAFNTFAQQMTKEILTEKLPLILISVGLLVFLIIMGKLGSRIIPVSCDYERKVNEYSITMPNVGYMGYPVALGVFGEAALLDCMLFTIPANIYINTYALNMLTESGKDKSKKLIFKIFNPPTIGLILGSIVGLFGLKLPSVVTSISSSASDCYATTAMLLTGIVISRYNIKELILDKTSYIVTAIRLVAIPAIICVLIKLLHLEIALIPAVVLFAMPCGMNTVVFPQLVGRDSKKGASLVLISTVLSMLTIPLCVYLLKNFLL